MFTNYDSKENCHAFLRRVNLKMYDGTHYCQEGVYHLRNNEYTRPDFVVRYRKTVDGQKMYGVFKTTYYYDGCCRCDDPSRFLTEADIIDLLIAAGEV